MSENEQGTFKPQFGAELNIESIIGHLWWRPRKPML